MRCRFLLAAAFMALIPALSEACTIPVFRFALDRWEADKFELVLPEAVAREPRIIDLLRPLRAGGQANLQITTEAAVTQPELRFPGNDQARIWSGALDGPSLYALVDSPARRQLADRILAGDSIVWVLVDGDSAADRAQADRIGKRLRFLEQVAALPLQNPDDPDSRLGPGPPLKLKFSVLRVRRDDPAETALVHMLAGPQTRMAPAQTSFAAAVFGRGRVLRAWTLEELDDPALEDACLFLVGRCSCRVKNENPGWDLLLNVDWERALKAAAAGGRIDAAPVPSSELKVPVQKAAPGPAVVTTSAEPPASILPVWWIGGGAALLLLAALAVIRWTKGPHS